MYMWMQYDMIKVILPRDGEILYDCLSGNHCLYPLKFETCLSYYCWKKTLFII